MLANGGQRALGSGPLPRELLRSGSAGAGAGAGAGAEGGGVVSVDAAPYFLEDAERYLFHAAYMVRFGVRVRVRVRVRVSLVPSHRTYC